MFSKIKSKINNSIVSKMFFSLVFVMTFETLVSNFVGLCDGLCISNFIGADANSAYGLSSSLQQLLAGIAGFIAIGSQVAITKRLAKCQKDKANSLFGLVIIIVLVISIPIMLFGLFGAEYLSKFLGGYRTSQEIGTYLASYLRGFLFGFPFMMFSMLLTPLLYIDGDKKLVNLSIAGTCITNISLDIIFSLYLSKELRIFGVGLASSISFLVSTLILSLHFFKKNSSLKIRFKGINLSSLGEITVSGFPSLIKDIVITLRAFIINYLIILFTEEQSSLVLNVRSASSTITNLFSAFIGGLISTCVILGGLFYSEEDESSLNELFHTTLKYDLIFNGLLGIIYCSLAYPFTMLYGIKGEDAINLTVIAMRLGSLELIFSGITASTLGVFQGSKRTILAIIITTLQSFAFPILSCLIFGHYLGVIGVFMCETMGFIMYGLCYFIFAWIYSKKLPIHAREFYFLPKKFGYKPEDKLEMNITSITDALGLRDKTLKFCEEHNIDSRRKENLAACVEEVGIIIVLSGFSKDTKKKHFASMKVLYKDGNLVLRTRDDCIKLDLNYKEKLINNNKDVTSNMAIRIVMSLAKSVNYINTLNTNNLVISL